MGRCHDVNPPSPSRTCRECGLEIAGELRGTTCPRCSLRLALSPEAEDSSIGATSEKPSTVSRFFGDHELLNEIARGGMGVVYRARQLGLNRVVALKMVQSHHLLSDEARLRFRVEIEAVAQLHHPHIVSLYESGEHDGAHYFTMRLVEGGDLSTYLQQGHRLEDLIRLLMKVCRAVHYAHQRGILHRDLKPSNILVDGQGEPHVADFGLAKSVDQDSGFTFTSSVLGSPSYMAPEQASGHTRQLTTAIDVYGLGAMLYQVLTGTPPFRGATPIETLRQVVDQDPAPPRSLNPRVDPDLATIALKCLNKAPLARYGSAEELARDLERWLAGDPIQARPLGRLTTTWRWGRRHPLATTLGAALVLALAGVVVATSVAAVRVRQAEKRAEAQLANARVSEARALRLRGAWGGRSEGLRLLREAATLDTSEDLQLEARNEVLALLPRTDMPFVVARPDAPSAAAWLVRLDPALEHEARVEAGTSIVIRALPTGDVLRRFSAPSNAVTALDHFSPNGRFLAVQHTDHTIVWDVTTGETCWSRPGSLQTAWHTPRRASGPRPRPLDFIQAASCWPSPGRITRYVSST